MKAYGRLRFNTFLEVFALKDLSDGGFGGEPNEILASELGKPFAVEANLCAARVKQLEDLLLIGLGVFKYLLERERRPRGRPTRRVADHPCERANQEDHLMAELLEMSHLADEHR